MTDRHDHTGYRRTEAINPVIPLPAMAWPGDHGTSGAAMAYAERGWAVFPCKGKRPLTGHGCKDATTDPQTIRQLWQRIPPPNIGLATGEPSGIWVLDVDGEVGEATLAALEAQHGELPRTVIARTGGGGRHVLFRYHGEPIKNRAGDIGLGLDVRATGGYIIAPPSVHPDTGMVYEWDADRHPASTSIADAPAWLIKLVCGNSQRQRERLHRARTMNGHGSPAGAPGSRYAEKALEDECRTLAQTQEGGRNQRLNTAAFNLGQLVGGDALERDRAERCLLAAAERCGLVAEDGEGQAMATIRSGLDAGIQQPRTAPEAELKTCRNGRTKGSTGQQTRTNDRKADQASAADGQATDLIAVNPTEDGIARVLAAQSADNLRYCHDWGMWLRWNGTRWERDRRRLVFHLARMFARQANRERKAGPAKASTAAGVERFAQADPRLATVDEEWDPDPWLLGTPGGTVDLRTGELQPSRRKDHITKQTAVTPAPVLHDDHPLWTQFLEDTTGGDKELQRFLKQIAGYCLTGDVSEECLFFVYGPGGNGKGVFLQTIGNILGDYATSAAMDTFTASQGDRHPTDLAKLKGARMVTASETEEGRAWAESRIKELTGNERPISARFMRQDFFEYWPTFKLVFVGNHKPVLRNVDDAARRRFNIIPFTQKPKNPDKELKDKLREEYPAILRWMIEGCLDWQRSGLIRPAVVKEATAEYFSEQDSVRQWVEECCETGGRNISDTTANLFGSWSRFAEANGERPGTTKSFSQALQRHGYEPVAETPGHRKKRGFLRISVKAADTSSQWQNRMEADDDCAF